MTTDKNLLVEPWDAAEYLTTKQDVTAYLNAALAENDPQLAAAALGDIARSEELAKAATDSGQDRESLCRSLSETTNPKFASVLKALNVLGVRLQAVPL